MIDGLTPYPSYERVEEDWLGQIPTSWSRKRLSFGFDSRRVKNEEMQETRVLSLSYGRIIVKRNEDLHGLVPDSFEGYQLIEPADIVVRGTDLQNDQRSLRIGQAENHGIITSAYTRLIPRKNLNPRFAYLLLHGYDVMKVLYGYGSGLRQTLDLGDLRRLPIVIPPLEDQAAIVRYLDHIDSRIQRFIAAKERLIELLEEEKQAIIRRAVTRGLDPDVPLGPSGIDWLGDVPDHWEVVPLKRAVAGIIDCEHKTAPAVDESPYRVVRTSAVRGGGLVADGTYCTTPEAFAEWTRRGRPQAGDVIFTREAPAGEACLVPPTGNYCLGQRTVLLKTDATVLDPQFLVDSIYGGEPRVEISVASQGSTVPHFNVDDIGRLRLLLPPLAEQKQILASLDRDRRMINATTDAAQRHVALAREYRTRLISDAVTGKLDVRDAARELHADPAVLTAALDEHPGEAIA